MSDWFLISGGLEIAGMMIRVILINYFSFCGQWFDFSTDHDRFVVFMAVLWLFRIRLLLIAIRN